MDVPQAYRYKADRAAHRAVHRVQSGHHQSAGEFRPARADGVVRGVPDRAGGVLPAFCQAGEAGPARPGGGAGVQRLLRVLRRGVHHRRAYDGAVFRRHRPEQGDVCRQYAVPVLYHQPHQLHHADGAGLFQRGTAAYGGAGYGVHPAGAVDRYTAEPEDVRRRGPAGGVHRRGRQRPGDAGAGADEIRSKKKRRTAPLLFLLISAEWSPPRRPASAPRTAQCSRRRSA